MEEESAGMGYALFPVNLTVLGVVLTGVWWRRNTYWSEHEKL